VLGNQSLCYFASVCQPRHRLPSGILFYWPNVIGSLTGIVHCFLVPGALPLGMRCVIQQGLLPACVFFKVLRPFRKPCLHWFSFVYHLSAGRALFPRRLRLLVCLRLPESCVVSVFFCVACLTGIVYEGCTFKSYCGL